MPNMQILKGSTYDSTRAQPSQDQRAGRCSDFPEENDSSLDFPSGPENLQTFPIFADDKKGFADNKLFCLTLEMNR